MGTALFTAVSGLLAFQSKLDVVANNIANVNTTAYRRSRTVFQDLFSQTLQGARAPVGNFGGSNPIQTGLGVRVGSIDIDFSEGSLLTTGVTSDLAIQGGGFFILSDRVGNSYTRDGSFSISADGFLIDPSTGTFVQGFGVDATGAIDLNAGIGDLSIPIGGTAIVRQTTLATLLGNLSSDAVIGKTTPDTPSDPGVPGVVNRTIQVFDSLGTSRDIQITFTKRLQLDDGSGTLFNAWNWQADFNGTNVTNVPAGSTGTLLFGADGAFSTIGSEVGGVFTALAAGTDAVTIPVALFTGPSVPVTPLDFNIDFNLVSELSAESDLTLSNQDGFPRGVLESFNIGANGTINGIFTNGLTQVLGQVALANFSNVGGLTRAGNNLFRSSPASGTPQIGTADSGGRGSISGGVLEGSNVDLATEFSDMIITQRGFQANARTITAADTLLQETVNLIR